MASVTMAISQPLTTTQGRSKQPLHSQFFLQLLPVKPSKVVFSTNPKSRGQLEVHASLKEKAARGLTAAVLTASMLIPEVAEAAGSDISPSLKNFLLSIVAGGAVLGILVGAVIAVANFDPVKRT